VERLNTDLTNVRFAVLQYDLHRIQMTSQLAELSRRVVAMASSNSTSTPQP
jgi:hypothetical protein